MFILLGHWLEMRARAGASSAIKALMNLTPATASVIRNGAEIEVPTAEMLAGEMVVIRPGNKIPVVEAEATSLQGHGRTVVHVSQAARVIGLIAIVDAIRPTSKAAVAKLREGSSKW